MSLRLRQFTGHLHHSIDRPLANRRIIRTMSSFNIPSTSPSVPVQLPPNLSRAELLNFPAFKTWLATLQRSLHLQENDSHTFHKSPYHLRSINVHSCDFFGNGRLGFVKLQAEVSNDDGEKLPGSVFLRGGSVGMLLLLQPQDAKDDSEAYVVLTIQPRIPAGSLGFAEIPAGMLDDSATFAGGAAKEIEEETGLKIEKKDLLDMTSLAMEAQSEAATADNGEELQKAVYASPGGSDEFIPLFLARKKMKRDEIASMKGKLTGLREEKEKITLKICRLDELWRVGARDGKTLAALALYEGLKREEKI